jgi:cellobiose epimerase
MHRSRAWRSNINKTSAPVNAPGGSESAAAATSPIDSETVQHFISQAREQVFGHILPFWTGPALDNDQGGWLPWMSNDLRIDRSQPKGLIVHSRILWAFSAAYRAQQDPLYRAMADRAYEFLITRFWDQEHGGAFWRLDSNGRVLDDSKKIYGQAFYIYALAEYHRAFGIPAALQQAIDLFQLIERHAHDPEHNGYLEVCRRDWSEALNSRLSEKDMDEKKSMNNHLHLLEAYTNLFRAWPDSRVATRLRELIGLFTGRILDSRTGHFHHFFDEQWRVRSDTYTFGHDIEGSWLLCEAAEALDDTTLEEELRKIALRIAQVVLDEALDKDDGLCYEGKAGQIIDARKECWPQAEAIVGFINAFEICGDPKYLHAARRVWTYIEQHLVDRVHGEWFWRINTDGRPDPDLPKVSEWKGPYHGTRACLEVIRRLTLVQQPHLQAQCSK